MCYTLIKLGYTIGLEKSSFIPCRDSHAQAFRLLPSKKQKYISIVEKILSFSQVCLNTLQELAGKCVSLALAVPRTRLYTNEMNLAIAKGWIHNNLDNEM